MKTAPTGESRSGKSGSEANVVCAGSISQENSPCGSCSSLPWRTCPSPLLHLARLLILHCRIGIVLAFVIPRVPDFQINQQDPLQQATGSFNKSIPVSFNRLPANFSFPAQADLQVDTSSNYLPLAFESIHADVFDLITDRQIAFGDLGHMTFPAKQFSPLIMPLNFSYVASNDSDQTCSSQTLFSLLLANIL